MNLNHLDDHIHRACMATLRGVASGQYEPPGMGSFWTKARDRLKHDISRPAVLTKAILSGKSKNVKAVLTDFKKTVKGDIHTALPVVAAVGSVIPVVGTALSIAAAAVLAAQKAKKAKDQNNSAQLQLIQATADANAAAGAMTTLNTKKMSHKQAVKARAAVAAANARAQAALAAAQAAAGTATDTAAATDAAAVQVQQLAQQNPGAVVTGPQLQQAAAAQSYEQAGVDTSTPEGQELVKSTVATAGGSDLPPAMKYGLLALARWR